MTEFWSLVDDVAKHLGAVKESIFSPREIGWPSHKIGRRWKFKLSVDDWVCSPDDGIDGYPVARVEKSPGCISKRRGRT